ncbi:NAD-dependent protein deacylase [Persicimonas caeni]|uniref:protein acetyllysine N-acetyltransferase n=1 Tax=Persicimonas caeni TaxID=2292766 RepID=A0A4Y6Q066_PERCE|nr:Sir2 family NAD-dependent protein deacetylase [Persicimonas caeni]QDG53978.1 NAD-dependent protein deacylase [Persicimonas caeni]QED35199.1 NAD-dependent protein deacylase [Persicimonas caeni]
MDKRKLKRAAELIDRAGHILVFAGSGLSAESGIPTFRGEDGMYSNPDVLRYAHADALREEPEAALAWFQKMRDMIDDYEPNPGHYALARICAERDCTIATQNVDRLLESAFLREGLTKEGIWHLHGSLFRSRCDVCDEPLEEPPTDYTAAECDECGGIIRPDVTLFGEMLPEAPYLRAQGAAHVADVVLLLGTSGIVYPAATIPGLARSHGAKLIEINPNPTELSEIADVVIRGKTGEVLPEIDRLLA